MARFDIEPLDATFGATVRGVALASIDDDTFRALYDAWLAHALLVLPGQFLTQAQQIAFARRFGPLELELVRISNVRPDGTLRDPDDAGDDVIKILKGNEGWHADSTYMPVQAKGAVFSAVTVPASGGQTGFADMRAAHDALPARLRARIDGRSARHSLYFSQQRVGHAVAQPGAGRDYNGYGFHDGPVPVRPLVKVHPETGRPSLLIGRHAYGVDGLGEAESAALLDELIDFACQPPRVYHHDWRVGDVVIWDNRCLMHRATPFDLREPRMMWHTRLAGDPSSESALPGDAAATQVVGPAPPVGRAA